MGTKGRLATMLRHAREAGIKVNEVDPGMQVDGAGLRALADESAMRARRANAARNASWRSASETTTGD